MKYGTHKINIMKKQILILITFVLVGFTLQAQDLETENTTASPQTEEENEADDNGLGFSISGTADVYFRQNINADNFVETAGGELAQAPGTSFANLPGFSLGMANVIISQDGAKAGVTADLVFGPRGEDATFLSSALRPGGANSSSIVNQLFAYYNFSDKVTATIGNFNTFLGYEVISPTGNFNYSTSYQFSNGPFSHTGVKVDAALSDEFSTMVGVFNPTDATEFNPTGNYALGGQLGYNKDGVGAWLNGLLDDDLFQIDLTAGFDVSENTYLGVNATNKEDSFSGVAGYLQQSLTDDFGLGFRGEWFEFDGADESIVDLTLSGNYTSGNLTLVPEFRVDLYGDDVIVTNDQGDLGGNLSSFLVAAYYSF